MRGTHNWLRRCEHAVLRVVSLGFSLASAYAIRLFFAPLDAVDRLETVITWMVALGFGVLGYFVSRGLVHRMMNKEGIWMYAPIVCVVELVDIACNYTLAAEVVHRATWLAAVPKGQQGFLTGITYVVLSVIPLVSLLLAVVDMDLERSKVAGAAGIAKAVATPVGRVQPIVPRANATSGQPTTPRMTDGVQRGLQPQTPQQQQAKRAGQWQAMQKQREPDPVTSSQGGGGSAVGWSLLNDPAKQLAEVP